MGATTRFLYTTRGLRSLGPRPPRAACGASLSGPGGWTLAGALGAAAAPGLPSVDLPAYYKQAI